MTKFIVKLFLLFSISLFTLAQDVGPVVSQNIEQAQKQVLVKCIDGCLILSPIEVARLEAAMKSEIQRAYQAGLNGWNKVS